MKPASRLLLLLPFFAACGSVREWRELDTEPMTIGACYDGLVACAQGARFLPDVSTCDRGVGTWQSRWRHRETERNFPIRNRLKAEIMLDEGSVEKGWRIRYYIEQEIAKDMRRHAQLTEDDWSANRQDTEGEAILGEMLVRRLAPRSVLAPPRDKGDVRGAR